MRKIKSYQDFINEEINFKKALLGGAIVASTLAGCDQNDIAKRQGGEWHNGQQTTQTDVSPIELPNQFEMDEVIMTIGTDMNINVNGDKIGKIEERSLNWGKTFEYFDNTGVKKATGKEKVLSLVTTIEIFDENNQKIGTVEEEVLKGLFSFKSYFTISDASGKLIGESAKLDWLSTDIEVTSPNGELLCKIHRPGINIISDTWKVDITGNIDKRLVVFIPCYKTSADNERSSKSSNDD